MRGAIGGVLLVLLLLCASWGWCDDPRPAAGKSVSMEVLIVQLSDTGTAGANAPAPTRELILELEKQGKITSLTRLQLNTLDQQAATVQFGERVGVVTGRTAVSGGAAPSGTGPGGRFASSIQFQEVGTLVESTPQVESDGAILLMLKIEQTRLNAAPEGEKNDPAAFIPPKTSITQCKTTLRVPMGKWVATGGQRGEGEPTQTWILVTAKVSE